MLHEHSNFRGQDLRGRAFKNADLRAADFSNADLRGVNFAGADLAGAKFCQARMGRTLKQTLLILPLKFLIGSVAGYSIPKNNIVFVDWIQASLTAIDIHIAKTPLTHGLHLYIVLMCSLLIMDYRQRQLRLTPIFLGISLVAGLLGLNILTTLFSLAASAIFTMSIAVIITLGQLSASVIAIAGVYAGVIAITLESGDLLQGIDASLIFAGFACYLLLDTRSGKVPAKWLHILGALLNSWGSTQFAFARLHNVDFTQADLQYARFKDANILGCQWQHAKNASLAITMGTVLAESKVRDLMIHGQLLDQDFSQMDLHGLDFSGMVLIGIDFSNANLSLANFTRSNLTDANLSECNAVGTCFNAAQLTGACIKNWNIDTRTQLDAVICEYVYLAEQQQQRDPPEHNYAEGEFSKLYQRIADTIDLLVHNHTELVALSTALKTILVQAGNEDLFVQAIERKQDAIVVRIKTPPERDRDTIYKALKLEQQQELLRIQQQHTQELLSKQTHLEQAMRANQDKSTFIAHATHDLRNILEPINIFLDIGAKALDKGDLQQAQQQLTQVTQANQLLSASINQMQALAELESGLLAANYQIVDVAGLLRELVATLQPLAAQQQVQLSCSANGTRPILIHSDPHLLQRILLNLVSNAIKYADSSKAQPASVILAVLATAEYLRIDILDNGVGIAPELHAQIFKPLFQINNPARDRNKGSGLGLAVVQQCLQLLPDHQFRFRSRPGKGTHISLWLPTAKTHPD